jgi:hypothetical protein
LTTDQVLAIANAILPATGHSSSRWPAPGYVRARRSADGRRRTSRSSPRGPGGAPARAGQAAGRRVDVAPQDGLVEAHGPGRALGDRCRHSSSGRAPAASGVGAGVHERAGWAASAVAVRSHMGDSPGACRSPGLGDAARSPPLLRLIADSPGCEREDGAAASRAPLGEDDVGRMGAVAGRRGCHPGSSRRQARASSRVTFVSRALTSGCMPWSTPTDRSRARTPTGAGAAAMRRPRSPACTSPTSR